MKKLFFIVITILFASVALMAQTDIVLFSRLRGFYNYTF